MIVVEWCSVHVFNEAEGCKKEYTNYSVFINNIISCVTYGT